MLPLASLKKKMQLDLITGKSSLNDTTTLK